MKTIQLEPDEIGLIVCVPDKGKTHLNPETFLLDFVVEYRSESDRTLRLRLRVRTMEIGGFSYLDNNQPEPNSSGSEKR